MGRRQAVAALSVPVNDTNEPFPPFPGRPMGREGKSKLSELRPQLHFQGAIQMKLKRGKLGKNKAIYTLLVAPGRPKSVKKQSDFEPTDERADRQRGM